MNSKLFELKEQEKKALIAKVHGICSRLPGATFANAVEFTLDELTAPPAVNLADLVPEEMSEDQAAYQDCKGGLSTAFMEGANYMRAEILRRIEEIGGAA